MSKASKKPGRLLFVAACLLLTSHSRALAAKVSSRDFTTLTTI